MVHTWLLLTVVYDKNALMHINRKFKDFEVSSANYQQLGNVRVLKHILKLRIS